jgi:hypothetical protein
MAAAILHGADSAVGFEIKNNQGLRDAFKSNKVKLCQHFSKFHTMTLTFGTNMGDLAAAGLRNMVPSRIPHLFYTFCDGIPDADILHVLGLVNDIEQFRWIVVCLKKAKGSRFTIRKAPRTWKLILPRFFELKQFQVSMLGGKNEKQTMVLLARNLPS